MNYNKIPAGTPVLITGGTGFTGSVLLRKLVENKLKVKATARPSSNISKFADLPIEWFRGDVYDPETVRQAVDGVEYIFHVAAAFREAKIGDEIYHKVHIESTKLLAKQALKQKNFKRFLHTSTMGVHGHIENPPADEEYRFSPGDVYQKTKVEAELWVRDFAEKNGLPLTVIRPAAIYGPGDRRLLKIYKMAAAGWFPLIGARNTLYHLIHVEDLTNFYLFCATEPNALNDYYLCGNRTHIELKQFVSYIADFFHTKVKFIPIPAGPLFIAGDVCEFICKRLGVEPPIYRRRIAFFTKDRSLNTAKIHDKLGFKMVYDNETGIKQTASWYLHNNWINITNRNGKTGAEQPTAVAS
ncbi:MAG: NAD-dependent epimerase/dehydratase family protein [bacterium]